MRSCLFSPCTTLMSPVTLCMLFEKRHDTGEAKVAHNYHFLHTCKVTSPFKLQSSLWFSSLHFKQLYHSNLAR